MYNVEIGVVCTNNFLIKIKNLNHKTKKTMIRGSESILQELPTMSRERMLCLIRSHKQLRLNMAGYSSMTNDVLRNTLEKVLKGQEVQPRKKAENKWQNALKEYNTGNSSFIIPKKGSDQYNQVVSIMNGVKKVLEDKPKRGRGRPRKVVQIDQSQKLLTTMFKKA